MDLEEVNAEIQKETELWKQMFGVMPGGIVPIDTYIVGIHLKTLTEMLFELEIVDKDDFQLAMKERLLASMQRHRKELEAARRLAVVESIVPKMNQIKKFGNHG